MTVIKRDRKSSSADLIIALERLLPLLEDQGESDAVLFLKEAGDELKNANLDTSNLKAAAEKIVDAFHGEHELEAYTIQRESNSSSWTDADELSLVSSRVLNLSKRILKS